jgi:hypothetical protein
MTEFRLSIYVLIVAGFIIWRRSRTFTHPWYYPLVVTWLLGVMALGACFVVVLVLGSLGFSGSLLCHWVAWLLV